MLFVDFFFILKHGRANLVLYEHDRSIYNNFVETEKINDRVYSI